MYVKVSCFLSLKKFGNSIYYAIRLRVPFCLAGERVKAKWVTSSIGKRHEIPQVQNYNIGFGSEHPLFDCENESLGICSAVKGLAFGRVVNRTTCLYDNFEKLSILLEFSIDILEGWVRICCLHLILCLNCLNLSPLWLGFGSIQSTLVTFVVQFDPAKHRRFTPGEPILSCNNVGP